jgi:hypothetical protein
MSQISGALHDDRGGLNRRTGSDHGPQVIVAEIFNTDRDSMIREVNDGPYARWCDLARF